MLTYHSHSDLGSLWDMHTRIRMVIRIPTDITDRRSTWGRHFIGTTGIAFLSRDIPVFTVFTTTIGKD